MSWQRRLRCGRRRKHRAAVDAMTILRRMESRMDAIRRQTPTGVSRRASPAGPTAARKKPQTLVEHSRAMTAEGLR
jgi:hypothetical protein